MNAKDIYNGTKKFPRKLLFLNIMCTLVAVVIFAIFLLLALIFKSPTGILPGLFLSMFVYGILSWVVNYYIGYMFKYGAIHAIARAYSTGSVSSTYFDDSVEYIKNGFLKANVYMALDKLINRAVRGVTKMVNFILGFLPDGIKNIVDGFINIYLDYIDECCLAWSMLHPRENIIKTSCDGIVIYYQNAKELLKPAAKTTARVVLTRFGIVVIGCLLCVSVYTMPLALVWWLFGFAIVSPFLNHRVLCNTMVAYLDLAYKTEIRIDVYGKLNKVKAFQKLRNKINDPEFNVAPGNENVDSRVMHSASNAFEESQQYGSQTSYTEDIANGAAEVVGSAAGVLMGAMGTFKDAAVKKMDEYNAQKNMQQSAPSPVQPVVNNVPIPEPEEEKPTQEQLLWQQAWNRMTQEQKNKYNNMGADAQHKWKAQILKALFNYDLK